MTRKKGTGFRNGLDTGNSAVKMLRTLKCAVHLAAYDAAMALTEITDLIIRVGVTVFSDYKAGG